MADQALIERTITFLNELKDADSQAVKALIETRVPCNETLADHPTVQVQAREGEPGLCVGLLGVLNGLIGADTDGWGFICVKLDDDGNIVEFMRTPPRVKKGEG